MTTLIKRPLFGAKFHKPVVLDALAKLTAFVNADDANKDDISVRGAQIEVTDRRTVALPYQGETHEFAMSDHAFDQLAKLVDVPPKFLRTCPASGRGSVQDILSSRLEKRAGADHIFRIRTTSDVEGMSGVIRAALSDQFSPYDNRDLVRDVGAAMKQYSAKLAATNAYVPNFVERSLSLRMLFPDRFDYRGDDHHLGAQITTSEVGQRPVSVETLMWRLICKNGLMGWASRATVTIHHRNTSRAAIAPRVEEGYLAAARMQEPALEVLDELGSRPVGNPTLEAMRIIRQARIPTAYSESILHELSLSEGVDDRYSLLQAFTAAAKKVEDLAERADMEALIGGAFLSKKQLENA